MNDEIPMTNDETNPNDQMTNPERSIVVPSEVEESPTIRNYAEMSRLRST
jgi:hypothetical protein